MIASASLRDRLRIDTRSDHQQLDDSFSALSLGLADDLAVFLSAQLAALTAMRCATGEGRAQVEALLAEMLAALRRDLAALDMRAPVHPPLVTVEADAALYILLGSRLGAQVLARQWQATAEGAARRAGAYLCLDPRKTEWRAFCERLGAEPMDSPRAAAVVSDCRALFAHFGAALRLNLPSPPASAELRSFGNPAEAALHG